MATNIWLDLPNISHVARAVYELSQNVSRHDDELIALRSRATALESRAENLEKRVSAIESNITTINQRLTALERR